MAILFNLVKFMFLFSDVSSSQALSSEGSGDDADDVLSEDASWSDEERTAVQPALGLIMAASSLATKVVGAVGRGGDARGAGARAELDTAARLTAPLSPAVDELVLATYPPLDGGRLVQQVHHHSVHSIQLNIKS